MAGVSGLFPNPTVAPKAVSRPHGGSQARFPGPRGWHPSTVPLLRIQTAVAFGIHKQIDLHRAKRAASADNLAPETPIRQYVQVNVVAAPDKLAPPMPDILVKDAPDNPA